MASADLAEADLDRSDERQVQPRTLASFAWALPAVISGVLVLAMLLWLGTPETHILRYTAHVLLGVLMPGLLVHRSLRGRSTSLITDLSLGAATGTALILIGLALYVSTGIGGWLWTWPVAIMAIYAIVPGLRRHWAFGGYVSDGRGGVWLLAATWTTYTLARMGSYAHEKLPPAANDYYIDVYWHLANAGELTRRFPPDVPSVSGRTLRYHWFANADMAASHLTSGVDLASVVLRLWPIWITLVVAGLIYSLVHRLTGAAWPGAIAVALSIMPGLFMPWDWFRTINPVAVVQGSPSQTYGVAVILLAIHVLVDLLRGKPLRGGWVIFGLAVLLAPGAKPSVTPILAAGLACVMALDLLLNRSPRRLIRHAIALAMTLILGWALEPLVTQAQAASGIKIFGFLGKTEVWTDFVPYTALPATGGHIIHSLTAPGAPLLAFGLVTGLLLQVAWSVLALLLPLRPREIDPVLVFLLGGFAGAMFLTIVIDHAGLSQIYFERTGTPLAAVAAAWGVHAAWTAAAGRFGARRSLAFAAGGVAFGWIVHALVERVGSGGRPALADYPERIVAPEIALAVAALVGFIAWRLLRGRIGGRGLGGVVAAGAILAIFLTQGTWWTVRNGYRGATNPRPLPVTAVSSAETKAALWVRENTPEDAILATNTHCKFQSPYRFCESRSYWVTAFADRRAVVESWAYTEENLRLIGKYNRGFPLFPFDEPERLELNDAAISEPTPEILARLKSTYGATWIFADSRASKVSPLLDQYADLRLKSGTVSVYELR